MLLQIFKTSCCKLIKRMLLQILWKVCARTEGRRSGYYWAGSCYTFFLSCVTTIRTNIPKCFAVRALVSPWSYVLIWILLTPASLSFKVHNCKMISCLRLCTTGNWNGYAFPAQRQKSFRTKHIPHYIWPWNFDSRFESFFSFYFDSWKLTVDLVTRTSRHSSKFSQ